jgi:hypothetical protein
VAPTRDARQVVEALRAYTHLEDTAYIYFGLAVAVASRLAGGDPLWGLVVGGPSSGKTEMIRALVRAEDDHLDEVTAAGLLSWTSGKNPRATGVLTRLPSPGFATIGDLSTLLAGSDRGQRDMTYAMLRRVYDGKVARELGNAREPLRWEGKLSLLAAVTPDVDRYASHSDALGPRWLYCRIPELSQQGRRLASELARRNVTDLDRHRTATSEIVAGVIEDASWRLGEIEDRDSLASRIDDIAIVAAAGRTAVPRSGYGAREILGEAVREEPMRLVGQLTMLNAGLLALGLDHYEALRLVQRCALDSMPLTRRKVLGALSPGEALTVAEIARRVRSDRKVVRFALVELSVIGLCRYEGDDQDDEDGNEKRAPKPWRLAGEEATLVASIFTSDAKGGTKRGDPTHQHPKRSTNGRVGTPQFVPPSRDRA